MNQTPDTENTERAKRAGFISDLRALADLLENEPRLPIPYNVHTSAFIGADQTPDPAERIAAVRATAKLLGTKVTRTPEGPRDAHETSYQRGKVNYHVWTLVDRDGVA